MNWLKNMIFAEKTFADCLLLLFNNNLAEAAYSIHAVFPSVVLLEPNTLMFT